jgi:hypothetical protein
VTAFELEHFREEQEPLFRGGVFSKWARICGSFTIFESTDAMARCGVADKRQT